MDSFINNNIDSYKRRLILVIGILVGVSAMVFGSPVKEADKLTAGEAQELILKVKSELKIDELEEESFEIDEEGNIISPVVQTIKIYDANNVLLLEAPIQKVEAMNNKYLSKLINASDFLIENHNVKYYRLDLK